MECNTKKEAYHKQSLSSSLRTKTPSLSLYDCLNAFVKPEILTGNNMWYCPQCKMHRTSKKTISLWKCPEYLFIHLKRFEHMATGATGGGGTRFKIQNYVDCPIDELNMVPYVAWKQSQSSDSNLNSTIEALSEQLYRYECIAVCNHVGILNGGHYTAYCKHRQTQVWYYFNDQRVRKVDVNNESVVEAGSYLLLYQRKKVIAPQQI
jgi:ubiquitin C-terminal hydrolase